LKLKKIVKQAKNKYGDKVVLFGYNQTSSMTQIADYLDITFLGNHEFSSWAGSKAGLQEFLELYDLPRPHTITIRSVADIQSATSYLKDKNYKRAVFKVNYSTGNVGHRIVIIDQLIKDLKTKNFLELIPEEYKVGEGLVLQGWIEREQISGMSSLDIMVWPNKKVELVHLKSKFYRFNSLYELAGYAPILKSQYKEFRAIADKIIKAYGEEKATGPHSINFIHLNAQGVKDHGFEAGIPIIHDENPRIGSSKIAHSRVQGLKHNKSGIGWAYYYYNFPENIPAIRGRLILKSLSEQNLLFDKKISGELSGVFPYGFKRLNYKIGELSLLAISEKDSFQDAAELLDSTINFLSFGN